MDPKNFPDKDLGHVPWCPLEDLFFYLGCDICDVGEVSNF